MIDCRVESPGRTGADEGWCHYCHECSAATVDVAAGRLRVLLGELSRNFARGCVTRRSEPRDGADAKTRREIDGNVWVDCF